MKKKICSFAAILIFSVSLAFSERPVVKDIQTRAGSGKKVRISWTLPENPQPEITGLLIYRTTEQINSFSKLSDVEPVAKLKSNSAGCIDTLPDFKDYFYTVLAETPSGICDIILLSFNSTVTGVHLTAKKVEENAAEKNDYETMYPDGSLRKTPLPFINMLEGLDAESLVSDSTARKAEALTGASPKPAKTQTLSPYIFEEDLISPDGGDAYLLFEILKSSFVKKEYKETIEKLNRLVGTNISEETRNRAYFYLGESQYFNKNYEEAVRNFVKTQQYFPTLSKKWLEASLDRCVSPLTGSGQ